MYILKAGKSPGVDNIPSELFKNMPENLEDEGMAEGPDAIVRHTFTKERQPQAMSELSYHQPK